MQIVLGDPIAHNSAGAEGGNQMHLARASHEYHWIGYLGVMAGMAMLAGSFAMHGSVGLDVRAVGIVLTLAAFIECRIRSMILLAYRAGYRNGRRVALPALVPHPRGDEHLPVAANQ